MTITLNAPAPAVYKISVRGERGPAGPPGSGDPDHGDLTGLADDDHPQYHNDTRGDARYYTKSQTDSALTGKAAFSHTHIQSEITGLVSDLAAKASTSAMTSALAAKADLVGGLIPSAQIPSVAITDFLGSVASQSAMLALSGQKGDWCIRTDAQMAYFIVGDDPTLLANWTAIPHPSSPVLTVNGQTGTVVLGASDVGAQPVDATTTAFAGLSIAADKLPYGNGTDTFALADFTAFARTLLDDPNQATALATLGAQPLDARLTAIAGAAGSSTSNGNVLRVSSGVLSFGQLINVSIASNAAIDCTKLGTGVVDNTEFNRLNGCNEDIQTRLDSLKIETTGIHLAAPTVTTIYVIAKAQYAQTINGLYGLKTTSGTATVTVKINGTAVTGLSALSVTSTSQDAVASALNTVAVGDVVTFEITTISSPVDLRTDLKATRT